MSLDLRWIFSEDVYGFRYTRINNLFQ